jgi:hypothetical protein
VVRREANRARVCCHVVESEAGTLTQQDAEEAVPRGRRADASALLFRNADGEELLDAII